MSLYSKRDGRKRELHTVGRKKVYTLDRDATGRCMYS